MRTRAITNFEIERLEGYSLVNPDVHEFENNAIGEALIQDEKGQTSKYLLRINFNAAEKSFKDLRINFLTIEFDIPVSPEDIDPESLEYVRKQIIVYLKSHWAK